jgi:hypothetical protein
VTESTLLRVYAAALASDKADERLRAARVLHTLHVGAAGAAARDVWLAALPAYREQAVAAAKEALQRAEADGRETELIACLETIVRGAGAGGVESKTVDG